MIIEYKCPKCGAKVNVEMILTNPPITCYRCSHCDYHSDETENTVTKLAPRQSL